MSQIFWCLTFCCLLSTSLASELSDIVSRESLDNILTSKCLLQCEGIIENAYLRKVCTCNVKSAAFMSDIHDDDTHSFPVEQRMRYNIGNSALENQKREKELLNVKELSKLLASNSKKKVEQELNTDRIVSPHFTKSNSFETLRELLAAKERERAGKDDTQWLSARGIAKEYVETTTDLFKAEMGTDVASATKEDYLNWAEKQMRESELRLEKLLKFYQFIELTPDS